MHVGEQLRFNRNRIDETKVQVAQLHALLPANGLVSWTDGTISARVPGTDLVVIKPTGLPYDEITPEALTVTDLNGTLVEGTRSPSSDTPAHVYIYREMPEVMGVAHTHSTYATAWSARREPIPCVTTMIANQFGGQVPIGPLALTGTDDIGKGIVDTLRTSNSRAVLMANHGPFTVGGSARDAVKSMIILESVARTVHIARQLGEPIELDEAAIAQEYSFYQASYGR